MARIIETATGADALTFDDVLLQPGHSEVMPGQTNISTRIARDFELNIPIISSAMDNASSISCVTKMQGTFVFFRISFNWNRISALKL